MVRASTERRRRALLRAAQDYVGRSYAELGLTLVDVADAVGTSPRQLQRVFTEYAGEDFRGYLLRVRMRHAYRLLSRERNPLPIRVVAPRVGYRQASGLRQAFVSYYGYNPSEIQPLGPAYYADVEYYLDRIEQAHGDRRELESIRTDLRRDASISEDRRRNIEERIGRCLTGLNRGAPGSAIEKSD